MRHNLQAGEYKNHMASMRRAWNSPGLRGEMDRQQKLDIWFKHAPNLYGQLFTILMPKPMQTATGSDSKD